MLIKAGTLGAGPPRRDFKLSPLHKLLVADPYRPEGALVPVKALTGLPGVRQMTGRHEVTDVHMLFDANQIVFAAGAPSERFSPGPRSLKSLDDDDRRTRRRILMRGGPGRSRLPPQSVPRSNPASPPCVCNPVSARGPLRAAAALCPAADEAPNRRSATTRR